MEARPQFKHTGVSLTELLWGTAGAADARPQQPPHEAKPSGARAGDRLRQSGVETKQSKAAKFEAATKQQRPNQLMARYT